ncbi:hypothetical protein B9Z65_3975 [Elsinoe australis]|uniref:Uncharacterized protein n=1 Tax=Elsinoe australis TaxID=40998 RepID=A0A2P7Z1I4_9PEZI|nr:hypothetical protein B9Z65_3975 [Elsinoe australis]
MSGTIAQLTKVEANDLLQALLGSLRNTLATFGPDSPQTVSVKDTVRSFLLSMQAAGIETNLSRASLATACTGQVTQQSHLEGGAGGNGQGMERDGGGKDSGARMDVEMGCSAQLQTPRPLEGASGQNDVDALVDQWVMAMRVT